MLIKKREGTFNCYTIDVSFGELVALHGATMDAKGASATLDEVAAGIEWYLNNIPGPGEDKEEFKAKKAAEKEDADPLDDNPGTPTEPMPEPKDGDKKDDKSGPSPSDVDSIVPEPPTD